MQEFLRRLKQILHKYKERFVREIIRVSVHIFEKKCIYVYFFYPSFSFIHFNYKT